MHFYVVCNKTFKVEEIRSTIEIDGRIKYLIQKSPVKINGKWKKFEPIISENDKGFYNKPDGYSFEDDNQSELSFILNNR